MPLLVVKFCTTIRNIIKKLQVLLAIKKFTAFYHVNNLSRYNRDVLYLKLKSFRPYIFFKKTIKCIFIIHTIYTQIKLLKNEFFIIFQSVFQKVLKLKSTRN